MNHAVVVYTSSSFASSVVLAVRRLILSRRKYLLVALSTLPFYSSDREITSSNMTSLAGGLEYWGFGFVK